MSEKAGAAAEVRGFREDPALTDYSVSPVELRVAARGSRDADRRKDSFEIIWLRSGKGLARFDLFEFSFDGPVMIALVPGQMLSLSFDGPPDGHTLEFATSCFDFRDGFVDRLLDTCLYDRLLPSPALKVPKEMGPVFSECFARISEEQEDQDKYSNSLVSQYINILITRLRRLKELSLAAEPAASDPDYLLFRRFEVALEQYFRSERSAGGYALLMDVDPRALNDASRKFAGLTTGELIRDRILTEAKRQLLRNSVGIKELCYELGFEDPAYFTRFFRKHIGCAPADFRKSAGE